MFTKGHTLSRGKRRPGGGGKKAVSTLVNEAIDGLREDLPVFFQQLKQRALEGDREAAIYLIDRAIGKPKQSTDITSGGEKLTPAIQIEVYKIVEKARLELSVIEGEYKETCPSGQSPRIGDVDRTSQEGLSEGVYEEKEGTFEPKQ